MCVCVCSFQNSGTLFFSLKRSQGNAKLKVTTSNCIENFIIISPWRSVLNLRKDSQFKRLLQFDILICTTRMILEVRMKRPMWQGRREGAILEQNWGYQEEAIYNLSDSRVTFSNQSYIHAWKCMEVDGGFNFYTKVVPSLRHSGFISRLLPPSFHSLHADCDISVLEHRQRHLISYSYHTSVSIAGRRCWRAGIVKGDQLETDSTWEMLKFYEYLS